MRAKVAFLYKPNDLRVEELEIPKIRSDSPGGMGEYLIIEEPYLHKIPDSWSYEEGAWVETFSIGYFGIWGNGGYVDASEM